MQHHLTFVKKVISTGVLNKIIASAIVSILNVLFWWSIGQAIEAIALGMIASLKAISYHFIINRLLFSVITLINSYDDILFERKYKFSADATVIKTVAGLDLEEIENSETSLVLTTAKLHFEKWKDAREYYGNSSNLIVYAAALIISSICLGLPYLSLLLLPVIISFMISMKAGDATKGFWKQYNKNTKRFNYFSDVLLKSEFVQERKTFDYFDFFNQYFLNEFDSASKTNATLAYRRLKYQAASEIILLVFSIISLIALVKINSSIPSWLGKFTFLNLVFSSVTVVSSTVFDLFPKYYDYKESSKSIEDFSEATPRGCFPE